MILLLKQGSIYFILILFSEARRTQKAQKCEFEDS